jgi:hypothetical protein
MDCKAWVCTPSYAFLWYGIGQVVVSCPLFLGFLGRELRTKGFSPLEYLGGCRIMHRENSVCSLAAHREGLGWDDSNTRWIE